MGSGHKGVAPTTAMVLDALINDARNLDNTKNFKDWCDDFGADWRDKSSVTIYANVKSLSAKLKKFLGPAVYRDAIDYVEPE